MPDDRRQCLEMIGRAFPIDPVPRRADVAPPEILDFTNEYFLTSWIGRRWDEIDVKFLEVNENHFAYLFFSPRAFNYYLPALLVDVARASSPGDSLFIDDLISNLWQFVQMKRGKGPAEARNRWATFMPDQIEAIRSTLQLCVEMPVGDFEAKRQKKIQTLIEIL